ncbi:hypothetical protein HPB52_000394 [Rhipicephalus sanguineus]|uniref:Gamma-glutamyltransferase n=1 Tax=Rhipicephalus sanguineus TaxID=34632 RepID=A0A9D4SRA3_RHISA|nr:hypothetical protein HPB52_000394 [Rhipicephalus sanguineus]
MDHEKYRSWRIRDLKLTPGGHFFLNTDRQRFANEGPRAVYEGPVAEQMVGAVVSAGGVLSTKDLSDHLASSEPLLVQPVKTTYRGDVTVHTTPLPTHGAVLLEALNILECFDLTAIHKRPGQFEHVMVEALRHASADGMRYVGDPDHGGSIEKILSHDRARQCMASLKLERKMDEVCPDIERPQKHSGTTFLAAVDETGNVCALTSSLSRNFGCAVVEKHGFAVQARGDGFNQVSGHLNCFGPRKKPYHSLMPVMVTDARTNNWLCTMGAMGGALQPNILTQPH